MAITERRSVSRCYEYEDVRWFPCATAQGDAMLAVCALRIYLLAMRNAEYWGDPFACE
jgi:hypothetical protein